MFAMPRAQRPDPPALTLGGSALFLDLDGTLAPIMPHPDDVRPDPDRTEMLLALAQALQGRLAVVSGRSLEAVDHLLDGAVATVAAVHGLVLRGPDGRVSRSVPAHGLAAARQALTALADIHPGTLIEDKQVSLALHYRSVPEAETEVTATVHELARRLGLTVQAGHAVVELRPPGADKGSAIAQLMAAPPFSGYRPVFVGDDLTDEAGFAVVNASGGLSVRVGPDGPATQAAYRLADPQAVTAWLKAALT